MESLGQKLRAAREAKSLEFEQVSRETNIAARYLEALEAEDFAGFPGEPYIIGFLRNYGAYLDLDTEELLSLYRSFKIQENPVPIDMLLKKPAVLPKILISAAVILAVAGAGGGIAWFLMSRPPKAEIASPAGRVPAEHAMDGESLERRFYKGDSILVPVDAVRYKLELVNLGETVTIRTPQRTISLDLSQDIDEDLNNDSVPDLHIMVSDLAKNNPDMGVQLRFDLNKAPAAAGTAAAGTAAVIAGAADSEAERLAGATVIFSSPNAYPFTLQSNFQGYCMFRWEILFERDRRDRNERYFQRSDELNIQAQNGIRLWASNAQAAKFQIIGGGRTVPLELGAAGEVVVAEIRWIRDDENRYRLVLARLETGNT